MFGFTFLWQASKICDLNLVHNLRSARLIKTNSKREGERGKRRVILPVILPTPATSGAIHIDHRLWPHATFLGPHQPRLTERLRILQQFAPSIGEVVLWQGVEVPAETAQMSPIRSRGGHFEKADPIPENLDPDMRAHDYTVHRSIHVQPVDHAIRYLHLLPVHLHSHLLPEIHLRVTHLRDIERIRTIGWIIPGYTHIHDRP